MDKELREKLVRYWRAVEKDFNEPVHRQVIARMELTYLAQGAPAWLNQIKKV